MCQISKFDGKLDRFGKESGEKKVGYCRARRNRFFFNSVINKALNQNYTFTLISVFLAHSWFTTVVDCNELDPANPFQLNKLKYEDPLDEGVVGATMDFMVDFGIDIHVPLKKFESHVRSSL